jgi:hypothetical protein
VVRLHSAARHMHLLVYDDKARMPEWVNLAKTSIEEVSEAEKKVRRPIPSAPPHAVTGSRSAVWPPQEFLESRKPKTLTMTRGHDFLMATEAEAVPSEQGEGYALAGWWMGLMGVAGAHSRVACGVWGQWRQVQELPDGPSVGADGPVQRLRLLLPPGVPGPPAAQGARQGHRLGVPRLHALPWVRQDRH